MEVRWEIFELILLCALVTVLPRVAPMLLVNRVTLPDWFLDWLRYIPVTVISALFFREMLLNGDVWRDWDDPYFIGALAALGIGAWTRNIVLTVLLSTVLFAVLRLLL